MTDLVTSSSRHREKEKESSDCNCESGSGSRSDSGSVSVSVSGSDGGDSGSGSGSDRGINENKESPYIWEEWTTVSHGDRSERPLVLARKTRLPKTLVNELTHDGEILPGGEGHSCAEAQLHVGTECHGRGFSELFSKRVSALVPTPVCLLQLGPRTRNRRNLGIAAQESKNLPKVLQ